MLVLSVYGVCPDRAWRTSSYKDYHMHECCIRAARYVLRLFHDEHFPFDGLSCVSVFHVDMNKPVSKAGHMVMHAVRHVTQVDVPIVPRIAHAWLTPHLDVNPHATRPMSIDLRYTPPCVLPDEINAMLHDERTILHTRKAS